jgi:hypothetical protein
MHERGNEKKLQANNIPSLKLQAVVNLAMMAP